MPIMSCKKDGKSGYKYGESGHCYTYTKGNESSRKQAKSKAAKQGRAIEANKHKGSQEALKILKALRKDLEDVGKYLK